MTLHERAVEAVGQCGELDPLVSKAMTLLLQLASDSLDAARDAQVQAAKVEDNFHRWVESVEVQVDQLRRELWT